MASPSIAARVSPGKNTGTMRGAERTLPPALSIAGMLGATAGKTAASGADGGPSDEPASSSVAVVAGAPADEVGAPPAQACIIASPATATSTLAVQQGKRGMASSPQS